MKTQNGEVAGRGLARAREDEVVRGPTGPREGAAIGRSPARARDGEAARGPTRARESDAVGRNSARAREDDAGDPERARDSDAVGRGPGRPRDEEARKRILNAALELVEEQGFAQVTSDAIAERAGASKSTVYRWWPNKAAVVIEAFREAVEPEVPFPDTGSFRADITTQVRNFARLMSGRGGRMLTAFVVAARSDPEVAEAFRTIWSDPRRAEAKEMLRRCQQRRQLRPDVDLDLVLDALYGPLYYRLLAKNEAPSARYAEALVDLVLRGLEDRP